MHAMRRPFVGGNWKMNTTRAEGVALVRAIVSAQRMPGCEVVVFPPFPSLHAIAEALEGTSIGVGAQDVSAQRAGAFTGQVSAEMLLDSGTKWAIIGHSERRHGLGESDELCGKKLNRALEAGLRMVLCVGETWEERSAGRAHDVTHRQLAAAFVQVGFERLASVVVAYEPVWAIGTGKTASAQDAQEAHRSIRKWLGSRYDSRSAEGVRILYGGSVNASNAATLFSEPDVDGGLIGGASLKAAEFVSIIAATQPARPSPKS